MLLQTYGRNLLALRLCMRGRLTKDEMISLRLSERCPSLLELLLDHSPLPSFLPTLPASIQHLSFSPSERTALWGTEDMDNFLSHHSSLKILSITGHQASAIFQAVYGEQQEERTSGGLATVESIGSLTAVQKYAVIQKWTRYARLELFPSDWPWVSFGCPVSN